MGERIYSNLGPIIDNNSKILILGSLPGPESLKNQKYYDKNGNVFWKIIYSIYGDTSLPENYNEKIKIITKNSLALWDVLESAHRKTAADSDILLEEPNDFDTFLERYPNLKAIIFNGRMAEASFEKYFEQLYDEIPHVRAWSTSGAWARKFDDKLQNWKYCLSEINSKI